MAPMPDALVLEALPPLRFADGRPLAAASGLVVDMRGLWVIGDDLLHLGHFSAVGQGGRRIRLLTGRLPRQAASRKQAKPDFEILLRWRGGLLALGSGSLPQRERGVWLPPGSGAPQVVSLAPLYARLRDELGPLNLEGGFAQQGRLSLLQRANAGGLGNVRVQLSERVLAGVLAGAPLPPRLRPELQPMALGRLVGVALGFTDGCALPGRPGQWLFSAAAEDTRDAVADGACMGSVVGLADAHGKVLAQHRLPGAWKVEGLAARRWRDGQLTLAMVCDGDDPARAAPLFKARWPAPPG